MVVMLFLGGIQLLALGIIGEYLGRTFDETQRRPLHFVQAHEPPSGIEAVMSQLHGLGERRTTPA